MFHDTRRSNTSNLWDSHHLPSNLFYSLHNVNFDVTMKTQTPWRIESLDVGFTSPSLINLDSSIFNYPPSSSHIRILVTGTRVPFGCIAITILHSAPFKGFIYKRTFYTTLTRERKGSTAGRYIKVWRACRLNIDRRRRPCLDIAVAKITSMSRRKKHRRGSL
jgi:hypothetical protein